MMLSPVTELLQQQSNTGCQAAGMPVFTEPGAPEKPGWDGGIVGGAASFLDIAGALCPPGRNYRLRGIPFGWSRVALLAERRPRAGTWHALESTSSRGRRYF